MTFAIHAERVGERASAWQQALLPGPHESSIPNFQQAVSADAWYLVISDRGTSGLGGPIRATDRPMPGERNDFVQFLRNVGEPRDSALGGGTYGFGKGIFYRTSRIKTLLADTRIQRNGGYERRIFGAALGSDYWAGDQERYTGRHWWGVEVDGVVDPLLGEQAEAFASNLGLPGFESGETGTNVVVLGVDLGLVGADDEIGFADPQALGAHLASAILWNLWPRFKSLAGNAPGMNFSVHVAGEEVAIPDPGSIAALRPFTDSLRRLRTGGGRKYQRTAAPKIHVGDLEVTLGLAPASESAVINSARPFQGAPHHIARMRQVGLVVDYFAGPPHQDPLASYGGVFQASAEADEVFASAEPPTHDRWNPEGLDKASRAVVDGAQRWVREDLNRRFITSFESLSGTPQAGLGHGSHRLAGLMATIQSTAPGPLPGAPSRGRGTGGNERGNRETREARASASIIGDSWIDALDGEAAIFTRVLIENPAALEALRGRFDVVLDGGARETEAPLGGTRPTMICWFVADNPSIMRHGDALSDFRGHSEWIAVGTFSDSVLARFILEMESARGT